MRYLTHILMPLLRLNSGQWENWIACNGRLMTGYRCHYCGKLTRIRPMYLSQQ